MALGPLVGDWFQRLDALLATYGCSDEGHLHEIESLDDERNQE